MMKFSQRSINQILQLYQNKLVHHKYLVSAVSAVRTNSDFLHMYLEELDNAIKLLNQYNKTGKIKFNHCEILINANHLKNVMPNHFLPTLTQLTQDILPNSTNETVDQFFKMMNIFDFWNEISQASQLTAVLTVASYRTYLRVIWPVIEKKGVQVASALEEILAVMAVNGLKTHLFQATKHWILDWKNEGFSQELAKLVQNI